MSHINRAILNHFLSVLKGHKHKLFSINRGPIKEILPSFNVIRVAPGPCLDLWTYASIGAHRLTSDDNMPLEFVLLSPIQSPSLVKLIIQIIERHSKRPLSLNQTAKIDSPWLDDSICQHCLITQPYPLGIEAKQCRVGESDIQIAWLLPITSKEAEYHTAHGINQLEQVFQDNALEYWNITRESLV